MFLIKKLSVVVTETAKKREIAAPAALA